MKTRRLVLILILAVVCTMIPQTALAAHKAKKVKMPVYTNVVKSGRTVYCTTRLGIWKVKVTKHGKVKSKKWLLDPRKENGGMNYYILSMKKKGNHLYYLQAFGASTALYRVNLSNGKKKKLASEVESYAIRKNKLYTKIYLEWTDKTSYRCMKLNGKNKKKTKVKAVNQEKKSNAKGYAVIAKTKGAYLKMYLKTPKGKTYLGKLRNVDFE